MDLVGLGEELVELGSGLVDTTDITIESYLREREKHGKKV
jgi:hypothetical protein